MERKRNFPPHSFEKQKYYPGTSGNPFDLILHSAEKFERIPGIFFCAILIVLSILSSRFDWKSALVLLVFLLSDWVLIFLLPATNRSFGPIKPVVLMLALLRCLFGLLPFWWCLSFQIIGSLLILYGFFIEPFHIKVHHEFIETKKLPSGVNLRVVHLGDLHIERITRREKQIQQILETEKPDLILFSGDVLNLSYVHDHSAQLCAQEFLQSLHAPLGVFGVTGSPPVDPTEVFSSMVAGTELKWLKNQKTKVDFNHSSIEIIGLSCSHKPEVDYATLKDECLLPQSNNTDNFQILLYHSPDIAPLVKEDGFDLQLSGHTHGGQIRIPLLGALYAASLYHKAFESGRYLLGKMTLYVTRGLGMEGGIAPRVRLFCPPEIIVWNIIGK